MPLLAFAGATVLLGTLALLARYAEYTTVLGFLRTAWFVVALHAFGLRLDGTVTWLTALWNLLP